MIDDWTWWKEIDKKLLIKCQIVFVSLPKFGRKCYPLQTTPTNYILVNGRCGLFPLMKVIQNIVEQFRLKILGLALILEIFARTALVLIIKLFACMSWQFQNSCTVFNMTTSLCFLEHFPNWATIIQVIPVLGNQLQTIYVDNAKWVSDIERPWGRLYVYIIWRSFETVGAKEK